MFKFRNLFVALNFCNPDGYIGNAGGRSIAALITILSALAIVVFVIVVLFKFGSIEGLINRSRRKE